MAKHYTDVMVDIETLSVKPNGVILTISAVAFNPFELTEDFSKNPSLDLLLELEEQMETRDVQEETLNWWNLREQRVKDKIFGAEGRTPVKEALEQFSKFVWQKNRIWAQGVTLDIIMLDNILKEYNMATPWPYHVVRDSRTLLDLSVVEQDPVTHDSLEDCIRQVKGVQQDLNNLGVKQFTRMK